MRISVSMLGVGDQLFPLKNLNSDIGDRTFSKGEAYEILEVKLLDGEKKFITRDDTLRPHVLSTEYVDKNFSWSEKYE